MNNTPEFSIRASVAHGCNMDCIYCPKWTGMENYCPDRYRKNHLNPENYTAVLNNLILATWVQTVSITWWEPFLNKNLPSIIEWIRHNVWRIELNTNGTLVTQDSWESVVWLIDEIKVSLDTLSPEHFMEITKLKWGDLGKVVQFIETAHASNVPLRLNCVVMKQNQYAIMDLIRFAKERKIRLNLLDFYWTEERSDTWKSQFIPVEDIYEALKREFWEPEVFERFGCDFILFKDQDIAIVRTKSSFSWTMRADKCNNCSEYCQEWLYCLRYSTQWWVTTCPSNSEEKGILLTPEDTIEDVSQKVKWLVKDLVLAKYERDTFFRLLKEREIRPEVDIPNI